MLIMNQERKTLINLNNVTTLELALMGNGNTNEIYAEVIDGTPTTLGVYVEEERAREIFNKIAEIQGGASTFYMPEE